MHVKQCQLSLRDELCVVWRKMGEEIVQVEAPDVQVSRVGIWTQGGLCECVEREKGSGECAQSTHTCELMLVQNPPLVLVNKH